MSNPYPAWSYFASSTVSNTTSGAVANQPVPVVLDANNFNFAHAQTTGADLRCALSNGTVLPFWIEQYSSTNQLARIHVQIPSLASGATATVYIYYGNSSAASASSYDNTFTKVAAQTGITGLWHFDEGTGTTSADSSGSGLTATLVGGATWNGTDGGNWKNQSPAQFFASGSAVVLSGSGQRITVTGALDTFPANGACSFWFKLNSFPSSNAGIFVKYPASSNSGLSAFWNTATKSIKYYLYSGSSTNLLGTSNFGDHVLTTGVWYHIVICWGTGGFRAYIDGEIDFIAPTVTAVPTSGTPGPLAIGGDPTRTGYDIPAVIDEMVIFNRQVLESDIYALYARRPLVSVGAQITKWSRLSGNPIVTPVAVSGGGSTYALEPNVIETSPGNYAMFWDNDHTLGYSTSTNGVNWTYVGNVLGDGVGGESSFICCPTVFSLDGGTTLTCTYNASVTDSNQPLSYATSTNQGATWTKQGVALAVTSTELGYFNASFINDGTIKGIVECINSAGNYFSVSYSGTSLTTLTKLGANVGQLQGADIHKVGSTYFVWHHGNRIGLNIPSAIYFKRSADLINFVEAGDGPAVQVAGVGAEVNQVADPFVLNDGSTQRLFFAGSNDATGPAGGAYNFGIEGSTYSGTFAQLIADGVSAADPSAEQSNIVAPPATPSLSESTFSFTLSWAAVTPVTSGDTMTYTVTRTRSGSTTTLSSAQSGLSYAVTGAILGDVYDVYANESNGNVSSAAAYVFSAPSPFGGFV